MKKITIIVSISLIAITLICGYLSPTQIEATKDLDEYDNCIVLSARSLYEMMIFNISNEYKGTTKRNETTEGYVHVFHSNGTTEVVGPTKIVGIPFTGGRTVITLIYKNLSDGDRIIIRDNISIITYFEERNETTIAFSWYEEMYKEHIIYFHFKGNITDRYKVGDEIEIPLTLKHVHIETNSTIYDIDVFEEQWVSEEYFAKNVHSILIYGGLKAMDPSIIKKVNA